jgi:hypothetical protein
MNDNASLTEKPSKWAGMVKKTKKVIRWFLVFLIVFVAALIYFRYFFTYSDGYRAGLLQKFSHKGNIFKTYEGEMILSSVSSNTNVTLASEKFLFSVPDRRIAYELDTLQGRNVIVHYTQKHAAVFWRGETEYLVDSVSLRK